MADCQDIRCSLHRQGGRLTIAYKRASEHLAFTFLVVARHLKTHTHTPMNYNRRAAQGHSTGPQHIPFAAAGEKTSPAYPSLWEKNKANADKHIHAEYKIKQTQTINFYSILPSHFMVYSVSSLLKFCFSTAGQV